MTIEINISDPSGPLKRDIIELAFGDLGMAAYEFGRTAEEVADSCRRLDTVMHELEDDGIVIGYTFPEYGVSSGEESSGIPFSDLNAISSYLALRLAPLMGATVSPNAQANAMRSIARLRSRYASIPTMPFGYNTPRGAGLRGSFFTPGYGGYAAAKTYVEPMATTTVALSPSAILLINSVLPYITGTVTVGSTLTCTPGTWS